MINNDESSGIIAWFATNPVAANLLMMMILVTGAYALSIARVESFPSIPPSSITVSVGYYSGSASSAEDGIAIKLENALKGVEGIKTITSISDGNGVTISITKLSDYRLDQLYQEVKTRIDSVSDLPANAHRPIITRESQLEEVLSINMYGDVNLTTLQSYVEELRLRLLSSSFIQKVDYLGRRNEQIVIEVDEGSLLKYNLTIEKLVSQIQAESINLTGGQLKSSRGILILRSEQQKHSANQYASLPVKRLSNGSQLVLSDVAEVKEQFESYAGQAYYNGSPSVGLTVKMYGKSNISDVADSVREIVDEYKASLPSTIHLAIWNDQNTPIRNRLSLLLENSLQGIILVVLLLALFLNTQVAFWVALGLPTTFAGAMILMGDSFFGLTLNQLTTFGFIMALGIVVDDAVVIGESISEQREKHGASVKSTIIGAQKVATPTTFGVLTTMVAFLSMSLIEGELGKIFAQFALAAAFCLLFSLIESKLILPAHLAHARLGHRSDSWLSSMWEHIRQRVLFVLQYFTFHVYKPCLKKAIAYRYAVVCLFITLFILVVGTLATGKLRTVFFPVISTDTVIIDLSFQEDAGYGLINSGAAKVEAIAQILSRDLTNQYNLNVEPIQSILINVDERSAQITVGLSKNDERPFSAAYIAKRWQSLMPYLEGIESTNFSADMIKDKAINIELHSRNKESIEQAGRKLESYLSSLDGVFGVKRSLTQAQTQIDIQVNPVGQSMGLTTAMLLQQLNFAYQGYEIQRFQKGEHEVIVKIQYPEGKRKFLTDLEYAKVRLIDGKVVPLTSVAYISTRYVSKNIERINNERVNFITADLDKDVTSPEQVVANLEHFLYQELASKYRDLKFVVSGQQREQEEISNSFYNLFSIVLIAIYILLAIPLNSYFQPILIMCTIPFGIIGALVGHLLQVIPISILSLFGMLALTGVVVNDSLLLISRYNSLKKQGAYAHKAIIESGTGRLRAIFLTSTTTYFGLMPLLSETSPQAQFLIPAATSMGYGILFATAITLFLVPVLVMIQEDTIQLWNTVMNRKCRNQSETLTDDF
ncbi:efflux RND transporter permease subunit [Vibrio europaeus]|uniref:efflux RND transporter permease subunit n=1 Tax=Vibrio europaeus TaxID=300876 RepID=UPI0039E11C7B